MSPFRGSEAALDAEIAAVERIVRGRVRRASRELTELERDLRELRRERARRNATAASGPPAEGADASAAGA
jgi:hypothetical protein